MAGGKYDCIVVGAGPAGISALEELSRVGARVLLIERQKLPRHKLCGGAISGACEKALQKDITPVVEDAIMTVLLSYGKGPPLECHAGQQPFAKLVTRDNFDALLLEDVRAHGCEVREDTKLVTLEENSAGVRVGTSKGKLEADILLGADGANGITARYVLADRRRSRKPGMGLQAEVFPRGSVLEGFRGKALVRYGLPIRGYGWLFPKRDHLSVGVGTFSGDHARLPEAFRKFLEVLGLAQLPMSRPHGHPIPLTDGGTPLWRGRILLAGDAAGLVDPLSGEGVLHAITSGKTAAQYICQALDTGKVEFSGYHEAMQKGLIRFLETARGLSDHFYRYPGLFHRLFKRNPSLLSAYFRAVRGDGSYKELVETLRKEFALARFLPGLNLSVPRPPDP